MELAPNLHRIGNDIVACYLVTDDTGVTVIDAGLPGHYRDLQRELASMNKTMDDVKAVILTHGDSDHVGFAERLNKAGVPVYVHAGDAERAQGRGTGTGKGGRMGLAAVGFIAYALRKGGARTRWLTKVVKLQGGETLEQVPGKPRIISLPGHSEGSIAIHVPAVDAVFVGDGLTTRHVLTGEVGPRPAPFTDEPERALASLAALPQATWVLPGHGAPFVGGTSAAVASVRA